MPKFRGDSEDWLDDEKSKQRSARGGSTHKGGGKPARSIALPWEQANALVTEVFPNQCRVRVDDEKDHEVGKEDHEKEEWLCAYRRAEVVSKSKSEVRERTPVAVGDRVLVKRVGISQGIIEGICVRKNSLIRPAPGRETDKLQHVLAANLDALAIVVSTHEPEFTEGLVDRVLIAAELAEIPVLLCVTKIDLHLMRLEEKPPQVEKPWKIYEEIGYPLFEVSTQTKSGLDPFFQWIEGKTIAFCGQSGVGKTSLLRTYLGADVGRVNEVNRATGKGRHTTTGAVLFEGPKKTRWIDTPGVKEFGLLKISPESLAQYLPEFRQLPCNENGCLHRDEPTCHARTLRRYPSYRRILESLIND